MPAGNGESTMSERYAYGRLGLTSSLGPVGAAEERLGTFEAQNET
jgi:hypothetical protein